MDAIVLTAVLNIYQTWSKYHGFKYKYKKNFDGCKCINSCLESLKPGLTTIVFKCKIQIQNKADMITNTNI